MKCQNCQFENPSGAKFCNECGNKLKFACPQCSKMNPPGSNFCNECGHNLAKTFAPAKLSHASSQPDSTSMQSEPAPLPEGERRQATIVFSDLFPATLR